LHNTAEFAVNAIRCWFDKMGRARYPAATRLMITADGGGSNFNSSPRASRKNFPATSIEATTTPTWSTRAVTALRS